MGMLEVRLSHLALWYGYESWRVRVECYGLNMKYPPRAIFWKVIPQLWYYNFQDLEPIRKKLIGVGLNGYTLVPATSLLPSPWRHEEPLSQAPTAMNAIIFSFPVMTGGDLWNCELTKPFIHPWIISVRHSLFIKGLSPPSALPSFSNTNNGQILSLLISSGHSCKTKTSAPPNWLRNGIKPKWDKGTIHFIAHVCSKA